MDYNLDYIFEEVAEEEYFEAKKGRDPAKDKWMDARHARRQMYMWMNGRGQTDHGYTKNGIPYAEDYKDENRINYYINGFQRRVNGRRYSSFNGKVDYGQDGRDCWGKPHIQGKSSRVWMKDQDNWYTEAEEALKNGGF